MPEFYMIHARKNSNIPDFFVIFAPKITKIPEFYMIFARKVPEFYTIIPPKYFLSDFFFWGGRHVPPAPPVSYAHGRSW